MTQETMRQSIYKKKGLDFKKSSPIIKKIKKNGVMKMFKMKMRKNTGSREASEVVTYKKEEKRVLKSTPKHDYSTYENSLESKISQNEAINEVIGLIR